MNMDIGTIGYFCMNKSNSPWVKCCGISLFNSNKTYNHNHQNIVKEESYNRNFHLQILNSVLF